MINVGVIGCGYWGPNLIRNFVMNPGTELLWACDLDEERLEKVLSPYPGVRRTTSIDDILSDPSIAAVAIATPVHTHFPLAKISLESGKHVLIEKPLASSVDEGEYLVSLAREKGLRLMCDHTFCYTGAVRKMKEIIESGVLGKLYYFDSVRINLGLFQHDINVVWDLAPHDLSILDFLLGIKPIQVSAKGACHAGNGLENIAYVTIEYADNFIAHLHLNWLSPLKVRKTIIGSSEKMLVWNDLEPAEKIKIYDKGIMVKDEEMEERGRLLVSYRSGDIYVPHIDQTEALSVMITEFASCIKEDRQALTDGEAGLRVLQILKATEQSIKNDGANVPIQ